MKIIVFGGAGFVGTSIVEVLIKSGFEVTVYDRNLESKILPQGNYRKFDRDFFSELDFSRYIQDQDIVIQLISGVSPVSSMVNIYDPYKNDLIQNLKLIESCKNIGVNKIIFVSSGGTVYGEQEIDLITEDKSLFPQNHYGIMKSTIEQFLILYNEQYNMNNVVLRLANPYGSKQNLEKKIGAVATFCHQIVNEQEIEIYGDGKIIRDYIGIEDVCESIMCAVKYQTSEVVPIFNVGTGIGTNLLEIISMIESETNLKANINFKQNRNIDVRKNILSTEKSEKNLNFKAKQTLHQGIKKILMNYREYNERNNNNPQL